MTWGITRLGPTPVHHNTRDPDISTGHIPQTYSPDSSPWPISAPCYMVRDISPFHLPPSADLQYKPLNMYKIDRGSLDRLGVRDSASFQIVTLTAGGECPRWGGKLSGGTVWGICLWGMFRGEMSYTRPHTHETTVTRHHITTTTLCNRALISAMWQLTINSTPQRGSLVAMPVRNVDKKLAIAKRSRSTSSEMQERNSSLI